MIEHRRRDHGFVGYDGLDAVKTPHDDVAGGRLAHDAEPVVDRNHVADTHRTIEQDRESRDVVAGELLQPEADADPQGAAEYRQHGDVDPDDGQRDQ